MKKEFLIIITLLFFGCITKYEYTHQTYKPIEEKVDEILHISYQIPTVKPSPTTKNTQVKGGVTISIEVLPFLVERTVKTEQKAVMQDPNKQGYDRFEVKHVPNYNVDEGKIIFKIRIRNNEQVPLRLSSVGFALIIDGTQWSFPDEQIDEWNKGLILTGFEKEFLINGPNMSGLENAQAVYILLNGVPTKYNNAGNITQKSNFEWYYVCGIESINKDEIVSYTYESKLIRTEQCESCGGSGKNPKYISCSRCSGNGKYVKYDGQVVNCYKCSGTGKIYLSCTACHGQGKISYPESKEAIPEESVNWYGWQVRIVSIPTGAIVSGCNPKTGEIESSGLTAPYLGLWYRTKDKPCPIILEYGGKMVKVMPFKPNGNPSNKIIVDFTGENPRVTMGQDVTNQ